MMLVNVRAKTGIFAPSKIFSEKKNSFLFLLKIYIVGTNVNPKSMF